MTKEEFVKGWCERSGIPLNDLEKFGQVAVPCDCGEDGCKGWQMKHREFGVDEAHHALTGE